MFHIHECLSELGQSRCIVTEDGRGATARGVLQRAKRLDRIE